MSKEDMILNVKQLHERMQKYSIEVGVAPEIYAKFLPKDLDTLQIDDIEPYENLFTNINRNQYRAFLEIKRLLPDEVWQRYKDFGLKRLEEQVLLRKAGKVLFNAWKPLIRRVKENEKGYAQQNRSKESSDGVSI